MDYKNRGVGVYVQTCYMLEDPNQRGEFDSGFKFYAIGCASEG
jgi:hypothetical protein